jgi:hypothetical protein
LDSFSNVGAHKSSSKNTRKMDLQSILNKNSPWAHIELEFDVVGVARKLPKCVVHSSNKRKIQKYISILIMCINILLPIFGLKEF